MNWESRKLMAWLASEGCRKNKRCEQTKTLNYWCTPCIARGALERHAPDDGPTHYGRRKEGDRALYVSCSWFQAANALGNPSPVTDVETDVDCPECLIGMYGK